MRVINLNVSGKELEISFPDSPSMLEDSYIAIKGDCQLLFTDLDPDFQSEVRSKYLYTTHRIPNRLGSMKNRSKDEK